MEIEEIVLTNFLLTDGLRVEFIRQIHSRRRADIVFLV